MIAISNLAVRQGKFALAKISFTVPTGHYAVLMGKSGCGKTTILEAIAGLRSPIAGSISLAGRVVTQLRPGARNLGYVPQDGALFSTMTVRENLGFALEIRSAPRSEIAKRVEELAAWLELTDVLDRKPQHLSGGEKQRVALGRGLAARPSVLLLDEPLGSLDDETRDHLIDLLLRLRETREVTVVHVTHSRSEADRLGNLIFRLENGMLRETTDERTKL